MMQRLEFSVLGPFEVRCDAAPLAVPRGRRSALLATLVQHVGRVVPAGELIEDVWGSQVLHDPAATLQTVVSRLRELLGPEVVRTTPVGYALDVPPEAVDAYRFEQLVSHAREAPAAEASGLLDEALALWRGEAYLDFADLPHVEAEARRLGELLADALEERGAVALDLGQVEEAVGVLEHVCRDHQYRERACALLMTALYRAGRITEALDRYRAYRELMVEELGLEPAPSLRDLHTRILGRRTAELGPHEVLPVPVWLDLSTTFLGRDRLLADLVRAVAESRLVTVTGTGGVGKTRLVAEALPAVQDTLTAPVSVVLLASVERGGVDAAVAAALGLEGSRQEPRAAVFEFCSAWSGVIVLDNCEHLREEVAALVDLLLRRGPGVRVLATSRRRLGLASEQQLVVEPLAAADAVTLFVDRLERLRPARAATAERAATLPSASVSARFGAEIAQVCELVDRLPLAVELTAARAAATGVDNLPRHLSEVAGILDLPVPASKADVLRSVVGWSYELLSDEQRRLLMLLSTAAEDLDLPAVEALARAADGWFTHDLVSSLAALVESSLLTIGGSTIGQGDTVTTYRMLAIVRAYAVERLQRGTGDVGTEQQARLAHARWVRSEAESARAEAMEGHGGGAGAGDGAYARLDRIRGSIHAALRWALAADRLDIAGPICGSLELCAHWTSGADLGALYFAAAEQAGRGGNGPGQGHRSLALGAGANALVCVGDFEGGRRIADVALDLAERPLEACLAHLAAGIAGLYLGDIAASQDRWERILDLAVPLGYHADAQVSLALTHCFRGDFDTAARHAALATATADLSGSGPVQAFARYAAGEVAAAQDPAAAEAHFTAAAARAEEVGAEHVSQVARVGRFAVRVRNGGRALDDLGPLLVDLQRAGAWPQIWTTLRIFSELLVSVGRWHDAQFLLAALHQAPSAPPATGDDVARYREAEELLRDVLGADTVHRIEVMAGSVTRTQVLDRATALTTELEAPAVQQPMC